MKKEKFHKDYFRKRKSLYDLKKFKTLTPSSKILYDALCYLSGVYCFKNDEWFFYGINDLCDLTNLSRRSILRAKKELVKKHFIDVRKSHYKEGYRARNCYRINGFEFISKI